MIREPVESSMMVSVGYDFEARVLEIEFTSGSIYQYLDVPPETYDELMMASSRGHYFDEHIRDFCQYLRIR